jgi:hypothetical protein
MTIQMLVSHQLLPAISRFAETAVVTVIVCQFASR